MREPPNELRGIDVDARGAVPLEGDPLRGAVLRELPNDPPPFGELRGAEYDRPLERLPPNEPPRRCDIKSGAIVVNSIINTVIIHSIERVEVFVPGVDFI